MTNFMDELLAEVEAKQNLQRIEVNRLKADQILQTIRSLKASEEEVNILCDAEVALIESYRKREQEKTNKKISWLSWQLEQFLRSTDQKTINLPHGSIRLRMAIDKVEVVSFDKFKPIAEKFGLLRKVPESVEADLNALRSFVKVHGVPAGVSATPAISNFTYQTIKGNANANDDPTSERAETEVEVISGPASEAQAA